MVLFEGYSKKPTLVLFGTFQQKFHLNLYHFNFELTRYFFMMISYRTYTSIPTTFVAIRAAKKMVVASLGIALVNYKGKS